MLKVKSKMITKCYCLVFACLSMLLACHSSMGVDFPRHFAIESPSPEILPEIALIGDGLSVVQGLSFINWGSYQTNAPVNGVNEYLPFPSNSWWAGFLNELDTKDRELACTLELLGTPWAIERDPNIMVQNPQNGNQEPGMLRIYPEYTNTWQAFVKHLLVITPQITYLQIENEPENVWVSAPGYMQALKLAYDAVQEFNAENPGRNVKVLAAGFKMDEILFVMDEYPEQFDALITMINNAYPAPADWASIVALFPLINEAKLRVLYQQLDLVVSVLSQEDPADPSFDILTIHLDRTKTYDTAQSVVNWYTGMMHSGLHGSYDRPIWVDDMASNYHVGDSSVDMPQEDQELLNLLDQRNPVAIADYDQAQPIWLVRKSVGNFAAGIERVCIAYGQDTPEYFMPIWRYMGLFYTNNIPKPAYYSARVMVEKLDGFTSATRIQQADTNNYLYHFGFSAKPDVFVAWREQAGTMDLSAYASGTTLLATHLVMQTTAQGAPIWPSETEFPADAVTVGPVPVFLEATNSLLATHMVTYNANGATSGTAPASQTKTNDVALTLATNAGNLARTGYAFAGWNSAASGTGTTYAAGASYTANAGITLYAKWTPLTYAVAYNINGATSGTVPASQTKTNNVALTLRTNTGNLAKTGYTFAGWNSAASGTGTTYAAGAGYTANAAITLYAKWQESVAGVYRFWSDSLMSHFFTVSVTERDYIIATWPDVWKYEGIAFYVHGQAVNGASPVHRFWSDRIGCHLFTISEAEKATLETRYASVFSYEGTAWYAFNYQAPGTLPVYRFWAPQLKKPFFTISEAEKDNVIANMSATWSYKGIAWYAYASASAISSSSIDPQSKASPASISESFISDVGQADELPGSVIFGLSYGAGEVVSAMVHDPVENTFMQVLEPTLSPRELVIPPLTFGQRYWLSVMSHHLDDEKMSLDYGGWLGRVSEVPEEEIVTVEGQVDSPLGLPVENIVLPENKDPLVLRLYDRADNRLIETIDGLEGGTTYELSVPAWNQWYRLEIGDETSGAVLQSLWIGHLRTH